MVLTYNTFYKVEVVLSTKHSCLKKQNIPSVHGTPNLFFNFRFINLDLVFTRNKYYVNRNSDIFHVLHNFRVYGISFLNLQGGFIYLLHSIFHCHSLYKFYLRPHLVNTRNGTHLPRAYINDQH